MALLLSHPELAFRDCEDCKKWWYKDDESGEIHMRHGEKLPRPTPPPCDLKNQSCKKGHWRDQRSLNVRNLMAYNHYRECRAVGVFPDDGVVRYNASIIREIEDAVDRDEGKRALSQAVVYSSLSRGGSK